MSRRPTAAETYDSLIEVGRAVQRGLRDLGKIEGKNDLTSDEDLRQLVLSTSKAILDRLPCLQLECDAIEHEDSRYGAILARLERREPLPDGFCDECEAPCDIDPGALSCQDQADKGRCDECQLPCDLRDGK
jgi:hypothetical protein